MMPDTEVLPSRDLIAFQLFDWLAVGEEDEHETLRAMMDVSQRLAADMFLPHCRQSDIVEPRLDADGVHILPAIREALEPLDDGENTGVMQSAAGLQTLIICERTIAGPGVPSRDDLESQLRGQQLSLHSRRWLRDLRRDSTIEIRN